MTSDEPDLRLSILIERHQSLDDEVDELSQKRYISQIENQYLKGLKVKRLRLRDAISRLREEG
jgi:uncharacterized protein YdcH (DUF465 family)